MNKEEEIDITIRSNIERIKKQKELSYTDLQRLTGIDRATLQKYIQTDANVGDRRRMTAARLVVVADALGADINELIGRDK